LYLFQVGGEAAFTLHHFISKINPNISNHGKSNHGLMNNCVLFPGIGYFLSSFVRLPQPFVPQTTPAQKSAPLQLACPSSHEDQTTVVSAAST
jgi:hypothetical protein